MKKIFFALIVLLFVTACIESQEIQKQPKFYNFTFEQGDYLFLTGTQNFEGQELILKIDDFLSTENPYDAGKVKLSLMQGNQLINSHYFSELDKVEEIFPLFEQVYVSEILINEQKKEYKVTLEFILYE